MLELAQKFRSFPTDAYDGDVLKVGLQLAELVLSVSTNPIWLEAAHRMSVDPTELSGEILATMILDSWIPELGA